MEERLSQTDLDELSAYMDAELTEPALSRVRHLLGTSPTWTRALERLQAVDRAMEAYVTPPAPSDLAQRVLRKTARSHRPAALARPSLRWMVPLTAAAAVVVAVLLYGAVSRPFKHKLTGVNPVANKLSTPVSAGPSTPGQDADDEEDYDYPEVVTSDNLLEDHLDFFRDLGVVNDLETIEAIYNQQSRSGGT